MSNGTGLNQDGSLRAQNIENEDNNAALELHLIIRPANLPGLSQQRKIRARMRLWFSFDIWPRTVISIEN